MLIGYARVSTSKQGQSLDTQREALVDAGCAADHIYSDLISGTKWQRPGLEQALGYMRADDTLGSSPGKWCISLPLKQKRVTPGQGPSRA